MQLNLSPVDRNRRSPIFHQMRNRIPVVVALCPEHAQELGRAGLGRRQLCELLYAKVRLPVRELIGRVYYGTRAWPDWIDESDPEESRSSLPG